MIFRADKPYKHILHYAPSVNDSSIKYNGSAAADPGYTVILEALLCRRYFEAFPCHHQSVLNQSNSMGIEKLKHYQSDTTRDWGFRLAGKLMT